MMIQQRKYKDRDEYVAHQMSKTQGILKSRESTAALVRWNHKYCLALWQSLHAYPFITTGTSVLCLGARAGGEVKAFIQHGCFAVGVDLLPTPSNKWVVRGDFNHLQFAEGSVDVVFTNCLDHTNDLERTVSEIHRVLRPDGCFLLEIMSDEDDWRDQWACCHWESIEEVVKEIEAGLFQLVKRTKLPTRDRLFGTQMCFRRKA
jgi:SAM-dependent methyltransferase